MDRQEGNISQTEPSSQIKEELQKQLQNYKDNPSNFTPYLETMKKIDQWLNSGEKK